MGLTKSNSFEFQKWMQYWVQCYAMRLAIDASSSRSAQFGHRLLNCAVAQNCPGLISLHYAGLTTLEQRGTPDSIFSNHLPPSSQPGFRTWQTHISERLHGSTPILWYISEPYHALAKHTTHPVARRRSFCIHCWALVSRRCLNLSECRCLHSS